MKCNDDSLSIEYESFACRFDDNEDFDEDFCTEYESFSFDPLQADLLFEYCKSEIVEFDNVIIENFDLDQTYTHIGLNRLVNFTPTILP